MAFKIMSQCSFSFMCFDKSEKFPKVTKILMQEELLIEKRSNWLLLFEIVL